MTLIGLSHSSSVVAQKRAALKPVLISINKLDLSLISLEDRLQLHAPLIYSCQVGRLRFPNADSYHWRKVFRPWYELMQLHKVKLPRQDSISVLPRHTNTLQYVERNGRQRST